MFKNLRQANVDRAAAIQIATVTQAQADAEVAHLHGIGMAKFQRAIIDGLQHSVESINASDLGIDGHSAIVNILTMQQIAQQHQTGSSAVRCPDSRP